MDEAVTRREHEEFALRIAEENERQDRRITEAEENLKALLSLTVSVEKLAANMESMLREMDRQGQRLEALEGRDGERWRMAVGYVITAVLGTVCGAIIRKIGG